jgi:hypothetical protein
MTKKLPFTLLAAGCLVATLGCDNRPGYDDEGAPVEAGEATASTSEQEVPGVGARDDLSPPVAEARIDDVTLGTGLAADGSIPVDAVTDDFAPGAEVNLAMTVDDAPAGSAVKVVWLGRNDVELHEETKTVPAGANHLHFQVDTDNWSLGDYRAEVWIGDERVNTQHFQIVEADEAG